MSQSVEAIGSPHSQHTEAKTRLGFWIYLMTDCVLFATLFATYIVLQPGTNGSVAGKDIFDMPFVLTETIILLASSFTCGMAAIAARAGMRKGALWGLAITALLGGIFLFMEVWEFSKLVSEGHSWQASAFLSAFFTLVGTHGLHILVGLIWLTAVVVRVLRLGLSDGVQRQLGLFVMFWHFLDVVWIFIFTIVYLMGVQ